MGVIFKREFKAHFSNIFGWIFIAVSIGVVGFFVISVNFIGTVPQVEYGLKASVLAMLLTIPFLCMQVFAPENKSGNTRFLLSLPIKIQDIVLGKYLAVLTVFAIPTLVMAAVPLLLSAYGTVLFAQSYASIFAYLLVGADMIAICMFIGANSRRSAVTFVLGVLVSTILYVCPTLSLYIPTSPIASFLAMITLELVIALIIWLTSKKLMLGGVALGVSVIPTAIAYLISSNSFTALFQRTLSFLSPFERMEKFTQGILDLGDVVYFISIAAFFLFFTYRAIQKTRDSSRQVSKKHLMIAAISIVLTFAVNLAVYVIPAGYICFDASGLEMYSLSDTSKEFAKQTNEDVTIYFLCERGAADSQVEAVLKEYDAASPHIDYKLVNVTANPEFITEFTGVSYDHVDEDGGYPLNNYSIIIKSAKRYKVIDSSNYYYYKIGSYTYTESEFLNFCQQAATDGYDISAIGYHTFFAVDKAIASGIEYVTLDNVSTVFTLTGHGEKAIEDSFYTSIKYAGTVYDELMLDSIDSIPDYCSALIISSPSTDISSSDADKIIEYLNRGGDVILITSPENTHMQNLLRVAETMGLTAEDGIISDGDEKHHTNNDHTDLILQTNTGHDIVSFVMSNAASSESDTQPRFPSAHPIVKIDDLDDSLTVKEIFLTSEEATLLVDGQTSSVAKKFSAGYSAQKSIATQSDNKANLFWYSSYEAFSEDCIASRPINMVYLLVSLSYVGGVQDFETSLDVPLRDISGSFLKIPPNVPLVWGITFGLITLIILFSGIAVLISRKARKKF